MTEALWDNGPFMLRKDGTLRKSIYSWNNKANLLLIDQPIGTGFSDIQDPKNYVQFESEVAAYFEEFIVKFLESNP
jgi:carboxypeptidase C (cathepsin A)